MSPHYTLHRLFSNFQCYLFWLGEPEWVKGRNVALPQYEFTFLLLVECSLRKMIICCLLSSSSLSLRLPWASPRTNIYKNSIWFFISKLFYSNFAVPSFHEDAVNINVWKACLLHFLLKRLLWSALKRKSFTQWVNGMKDIRLEDNCVFFPLHFVQTWLTFYEQSGQESFICSSLSQHFLVVSIFWLLKRKY